MHTDRIGSVIAETNADGDVLNKFAFSPFGESSSVSASNFGYTGQRYDSEIGLYNYKMRYYSPSIGRFLQPDPLGYDSGDLNLYAYVGNDAANLADPMGLAAVCPYANQYQPNSQGALNNLYQQLVNLATAYPGNYPLLSQALSFFNSNPNFAPTLLANSGLNPITADRTTYFTQGQSSAQPINVSSTINLNPALYVQLDPNTNISPLEALAHEIGHAYYNANMANPAPYLVDPSTYSNLQNLHPEEINSYALENELRSAFNLSARPNVYSNSFVSISQGSLSGPFAGYPILRK